MFIDISERVNGQRRLAESEARMELALDSADLGLWYLDIQSGRFTYSPRLITMLGYEPGEVEVTADTFISALHPDDAVRFGSAFYAHMKGETQNLRAEYRMRHKDGHWVWIVSRGKVVERDENGRAIRMTGTNLDISDRKAAEATIHELAFYDPLTHLPNRRLLFDRLEQSMAASQRSGCFGALMFLDLDNFKPLNDTYGHAVGDMLLFEAAIRLKSCVRKVDTVARFGGDEFVVMLGELGADRAQSISQAKIVAEKIHGSLSNPYRLTIKREGTADTVVEHHCSASIGVALFIDHEASQDEILTKADSAMYKAKEYGRNTVHFDSATLQPCGSI